MLYYPLSKINFPTEIYFKVQVKYKQHTKFIINSSHTFYFIFSFKYAVTCLLKYNQIKALHRNFNFSCNEMVLFYFAASAKYLSLIYKLYTNNRNNSR